MPLVPRPMRRDADTAGYRYVNGKPVAYREPHGGKPRRDDGFSRFRIGDDAIETIRAIFGSTL